MRISWRILLGAVIVGLFVFRMAHYAQLTSVGSAVAVAGGVVAAAVLVLVIASVVTLRREAGYREAVRASHALGSLHSFVRTDRKSELFMDPAEAVELPRSLVVEVLPGRVRVWSPADAKAPVAEVTIVAGEQMHLGTSRAWGRETSAVVIDRAPGDSAGAVVIVPRREGAWVLLGIGREQSVAAMQRLAGEAGVGGPSESAPFGR